VLQKAWMSTHLGSWRDHDINIVGSHASGPRLWTVIALDGKCVARGTGEETGEGAKEHKLMYS
jgi:hypothetical protein